MATAAEAPPFSLVLGVTGGVVVAGVVAASLFGPGTFADSFVHGGIALVAGGGLLLLAAHQYARGTDRRSWRPVGWLVAVVAVVAVAMVWPEVARRLSGEYPDSIGQLTVFAISVGLGGLIAWYDERRREEMQESRTNRRSYRAVFENVDDAILVHDAETGEILDANPSAERVYGYSVAELREMDVADFAAADEGYDAEAAQARIEDAVENDGTTFEWRNVRPDGERYWVEVSLRPTEIGGEKRVLAVVRDIDDRKQRVEELRVKDRALAEADVGITISEASDNEPLIYTNDAFLDITGYDREDVLGRNCRFLQGPNTDEEPVAALRDAVEAAEPTTTEVLNYRADGTPFWNEVTLSPVHNDEGDVTHFVGFQRDINDRKRRERLFSVMNRVLRHNLRNDLMIVGGHAELLAESIDGERAEIAETISETADDLTELGEKARELEAAVRSETHPSRLDATELVESVGDRLDESFPDAEVTVETPAEAPVLATTSLERALYELGENALEHGGESVRLAVERDGDEVCVRVADDGPGLPEMERDVLRAERETPLQHGQGIGLCLVNWIVVDVGGTLEVSVDSGTTVTVGLRPADEGDRPPKPAADAV